MLLAQTSEMIALIQDPDVFPLSELPDIRSPLNSAKAYGILFPCMLLEIF